MIFIRFDRSLPNRTFLFLAGVRHWESVLQMESGFGLLRFGDQFIGMVDPGFVDIERDA